ncbi:MAG TPA: sulfotransferase [Acidimicrobiia bacterium]|nr:sulfotransferase [Acidimicrobiia bacterium]
MISEKRAEEDASRVRSRGPIVVAGMARAGTSWVAEMLKAAGGFVHLNEPFNPKHPPGLCPGILNAPVPVGYVYVTPENAGVYRDALRDTFRFRYRHLAEIRANHAWFDLAKMAKYSGSFTLGALSRKRPLLDDPYASLASEWIADEFDGQAVVLVRHPAAMVASYRKLGYSAHLNHFLDQPMLMRDWLEPWQAEMEPLVMTDDRIAQVATFWRVLHHVLGEMAERSPRLHVVRYEDICLDPVGGYERLFGAVGVEFNDAARDEVIRGTTGSSKNKSHSWQLSRRGFLSRTPFRPMDSKAMAAAWRKTVTPDEAARIREITEPIAGRFYGDEDW